MKAHLENTNLKINKIININILNIKKYYSMRVTKTRINKLKNK